MITPIRKKVRSTLSYFRGPYIFYGLFLTLMVPGICEALAQYRDVQYVRLIAMGAAKEAKSADELSVVVALRDHVRRHVSHKDYRSRGRPFLRESAAGTLRSGKGRCGEATRAFINMADALGIRAQRLYLEGRKPHVVAEVRLKDGGRVIVDSYDEAYIPELESLDRVMQRPEFSYYSSFNWRRLRLPMPVYKLDLGPLAYYLENPHAIKALLWFFLSASCLSIRFFSPPVLNYLRRRKSMRVYRKNPHGSPTPRPPDCLSQF
ncbi:MAG: transglutaminase-like domain-containing protein [Acidobacteria bacterium]|nr:transglutaminase-like domain-containing protein [Acidobacteriota bacterium]